MANGPQSRARQRIFSSVLHQTVKKSVAEKGSGGNGCWTVNAAENNTKLVRPRATAHPNSSPGRKEGNTGRTAEKSSRLTPMLHAIQRTMRVTQKALEPDDSGKTLSCSERPRSHPAFFVKRRQKRKTKRATNCGGDRLSLRPM